MKIPAGMVSPVILTLVRIEFTESIDLIRSIATFLFRFYDGESQHNSIDSDSPAISRVIIGAAGALG